MEESVIVLRDPKNFDSDFHWPKHVDKNLKYETEFIISQKQWIFSWEHNKRRDWIIIVKI